MAGPKKRPTEVGAAGGNPDPAGRRCSETRAGSARASRRRWTQHLAMPSSSLFSMVHCDSVGRRPALFFLKDKWIYCSPTSARSVAPILTPGGRARVTRGENGARESR